MLTDHRCTKYTDCSSCSFYQRDIFKYRLYPKGYVIPQTRCMQNMVFFLVKGEIWLNSEEHPDTTFRGGQFVLQPIGSKVECKVLDYTECIIYLFGRPQNICVNRFQQRHLHRGERTPAAHRNDDGPADTTLHRGHEALPQR